MPCCICTCNNCYLTFASRTPVSNLFHISPFWRDNFWRSRIKRHSALVYIVDMCRLVEQSIGRQCIMYSMSPKKRQHLYPTLPYPTLLYLNNYPKLPYSALPLYPTVPNPTPSPTLPYPTLPFPSDLLT